MSQSDLNSAGNLSEGAQFAQTQSAPSHSIRQATAWRRALVCSVLIFALYLSLAYSSLGRFGIEKVLTGFAMPLGLGWLLLTQCMLWSWIKGATRIIRFTLFAAWMVLTLTSTSPLPNFLMHTLESQVTDEFEPETDSPLDLLIVFGGGTQMGPSRAEAAEAGDRVLYAAQLYQQGKTKRLITTGDECCDQTLNIWQDLNIPSRDIVTLPGANTSQEIKNLKLFLLQYQQHRIGILSSAYHLPRIQRLAQKAEISGLIPVAANHRSGSSSYTILDLVPSPASMARFSDAYKEWLGRIVGR